MQPKPAVFAATNTPDYCCAACILNRTDRAMDCTTSSHGLRRWLRERFQPVYHWPFAELRTDGSGNVLSERRGYRGDPEGRVFAN